MRITNLLFLLQLSFWVSLASPLSAQIAFEAFSPVIGTTTCPNSDENFNQNVFNDLPPGVDFSGFTRVNVSCTAAGSHYRSSGYTSQSLTEALAEEKYVVWSFDTQAGTTLVLEEISLRHERSNAGAENGAIFYSINQAPFQQVGQDFVINTSNGRVELVFDSPVEIPANGSIVFRMYAWRTSVSGTGNVRIKGGESYGDATGIKGSYTAVAPTLVLSTPSVVGLNYTLGEGPSPSQSYTLEGFNLPGTGNIAVSAPTSFEISLDDMVYSSDLQIPFSEGTLDPQPTTLYVRLAADLALGSYSGEIIHSGGNAAPIALSVEGQVGNAPGWQITAQDEAFVLDFDSNIEGVHGESFGANTLLAASPAQPGQLDLASWDYFVDGTENQAGFAPSSFPGSFPAGNGLNEGGNLATGINAVEIPTSSQGSGRAFAVQPTGGHWSAGNLTLKAQNKTGQTLQSFTITYDGYYFNDRDRSNLLYFLYSTDNLTYTRVPALDLVSPGPADANPAWVNQKLSAFVSDLSIPDQSFFYLRWASEDVSGSGQRDEFALDNIELKVNPSLEGEFYYKGSGALTQLSSWGTEPDGSGNAPLSFALDNQIFHIVNAPVVELNQPWILGNNNILQLGDGLQTIEWVVNAPCLATVNVYNQATLTFSTLQPDLNINLLEEQSTVQYLQEEPFTIPVRTYGNLVIGNGPKSWQNADYTLLGSLEYRSMELSTLGEDTRIFYAGDLLLTPPVSYAGTFRPSYRTTGNGHQTLTTQGETLEAYNFYAQGKTAGSYTFAPSNASLKALNNLRLDFSGSALFEDGGNTLIYGDDLEIAGGNANYNLTGTLRLEGFSGSHDFDLVEVPLNHLEIVLSGDSRARMNRNTATLIEVQGNFLYQASLGSDPMPMGSVELRIGGDFTDLSEADRINEQNSKVVFMGETLQTVQATTPLGLNNLVLDNPNHVTLASTLILAGDLEFLQGKIQLNDFNLRVEGNLLNPSDTRYVQTNGQGFLDYTLEEETLLPLGNESYNPLVLSSAEVLNLQAKAKDEIVESGNSGMPLTERVVLRSWELKSEEDLSFTTVTLQWAQSEESDDFDRTRAYVSYYAEGAWNTTDGQEAQGDNPYTLSRNSIPSSPDELPLGESLFLGVFSLIPCDLEASIVSDPNTLCQGESAELTAVSNGSFDVVEYLWSTGATLSTLSVEPLQSTLYQVTLTDALGCQSEASFLLEVNPALTLSLSSTSTSCGLNNGSISAFASPGNSFTYQWSNGQTTADIDNLAPGTYTLTATNDLGCSATAEATIASSQALSITLIPTSTSCGLDNGSISTSASPGNSFTYQWSNGQSTADIDNLAPGTYTLTATNDLGCSATAEATIASSQALSISLVPTSTSCGLDNGSISASASPGNSFTYQWSNGQNTADIDNLAPGSYNLTATSDLGCSATAEATIASSQALSITLIPTSTSCGQDNGSITALAEGGGGSYNYAWSHGETVPVVFNLSPDQYTLTVTSLQGCVEQSSAEILGSTLFDLTVLVQPASCEDCNDGSATALASGGFGFTYEWSNGESTMTLENLLPGTYSVTVYDDGGCLREETFILEIDNNPCTELILQINSQPTSCPEVCDGTLSVLSLNGNGPYQYQWSLGSDQPSLPSVCPGEYQVTVVDADGCLGTGNTTLEAGPPIVLTASLENTSCGQDNGSIAVSAVGPGPLEALWSDGATGFERQDLAPGLYFLQAFSAEGCTAQDSFRIEPSQGLTLEFSLILPSCADCPDGAITAIASGDDTLSYWWSTGSTEPQITQLLPGLYSLTLEGSQGCTLEQTVALSPADCSEFTLEWLVDSLICHDSGASLQIIPTGGQEPYQIQWSTGESGTQTIFAGAGTFSVTLSDNQGCVLIDSVQRTAPEPLLILLNTQSEICIGDCNGAASIQVSGGLAPYAITWNTGQTAEEIFDLCPGTYRAVVTDALGCEQEASRDLAPGTQPNPIIEGQSLRCFDSENAVIFVQEGFESYRWSTGEETQEILWVEEGLYAVTVTDVQGCQGTDSLITTLNPPIELSISQQGDQLIALASGGQGDLEYLWSNGETQPFITPATSGTFALTVTDENLCTAQATFDFLLSLQAQWWESLQIFPNPTQEWIKMEGSAELFPLQLQILDPRGILLREIQVQQETWINVSQLSPGLYYLRLSAGHRQKVEKLIKQ